MRRPAPPARLPSVPTIAWVAFALAALPGVGEAQQPQKPVPETEKYYEDRVLLVAPSVRSPGAVGTDVTESEPNDTFADATEVSPGDVAHGVIDPDGDVDHFGLDLSVGTLLELDVDAAQVGSSLDPILSLHDADGTEVAWNDDTDGLDSRIRFTVATTGRYYVRIVDYSGTGSADHTYLVRMGVREPGPGDPPTLLANGLGSPLGVAAGPGVLYVADADGRVLEVGLDGSVRTLLTGTFFSDVVIDAYGDLLVSGVLPDESPGVFRLDADGSWEPFVTGFAEPPLALTLGTGGDVWVAGYGGQGMSAWRYSPTGALEETLALPSDGFPSGLAVSPSGVLHYADQMAVYAISGGGATAVIPGPLAQEELAFDEDGYLYVANGYLGEVRLYDPDYVEVAPTFAISNIGGPTRLAFGRNGDGTMSGRLFATNMGFNLSEPWVGSVVELNPDGIRAPGLRIGADLLSIGPAALPEALMGADYEATLEVVEEVSVTWSLAGGELPPGVSLAASGLLTGVPEESGVFPVTVRADGEGRFGLGAFDLTVARPALSRASVVDHVLGITGVLTADEKRFLDLQGNRNGRMDVGDLQAFLRGGG